MKPSFNKKLPKVLGCLPLFKLGPTQYGSESEHD